MQIIPKNKANNFVRFIFLCFIIYICSAASWSQSESAAESEATELTPKTDIFLTGANEHGGPLTESRTIFDCTEKIISVVNLENYSRGEHHLSVKWVDPYSQVKEHTQYPFTVRGQQTRVWAWLSFDRGAGAGALKFLNPAAGLEDFIGVWKIEVRIDNKPVGEDSFEVSC